SVFDELTNVVWPSLAGRELPAYRDEIRPFLTEVEELLPEGDAEAEVVAHHAARCAMELAIVDCRLRSAGVSLGEALGPVRNEIIYNGMLPTGNMKYARQIVKIMRQVGVFQVKVKVGDPADLDRVRLLKEVLGDEGTILADANGAWSFDEAREAISALGELGVVLIEQPLARGPVEELAELRKAVSVPIMVDESLVTLGDAHELIAAEACDVFNVRLSKCGGLGRSLEFIDLARGAGLDWQLGCHVGETAVLSAAGRALGLSVDDPLFVEGSVGEWLLEEDLTSPPVQLGPGGRASALTGPGLGIDVLEDRLERYGVQTRRLEVGS
ncbi:MAG: enolase C-terminal domain-like protein, partial [Myxococcota bacterium]|nr:enolase C-terminal domain-like protein [Myxococcota bacterium]